MKKPLRKITPEFMADAARYPEFAASVLVARRDGGPRPAVTASLEAFSDDPFGLYACLWHAWSEGVAVTLVAPERNRRA